VRLFGSTFSPDVGTVIWSAMVPDLATLEEANDKLLVDDGFVSLADSGAEFSMGGAHDSLQQIIYGEPDPNRTIEYATTVQTVCAAGNLMKGMELAIEIARRAEQSIGVPVLAATGMTGSYGSISWSSGYADIRDMERAQQAMAADTKFNEFVDKSVRGVYADDMALTRQLVFRHLA
jgi:hypothetical protein